jgi:hypothetical protein
MHPVQGFSPNNGGEYWTKLKSVLVLVVAEISYEVVGPP